MYRYSSIEQRVRKHHRKPNEIRTWAPAVCIMVVSSRRGISHHSEIWLPAVTECDVKMTFLVHVVEEESIAGGRGLFISSRWGQTGQLCFACLIMSISFGERMKTEAEDETEDPFCPPLLCPPSHFALQPLVIATLLLNYLKNKLPGDDGGSSMRPPHSNTLVVLRDLKNLGWRSNSRHFSFLPASHDQIIIWPLLWVLKVFVNKRAAFLPQMFSLRSKNDLMNFIKEISWDL